MADWGPELERLKKEEAANLAQIQNANVVAEKSQEPTPQAATKRTDFIPTMAGVSLDQPKDIETGFWNLVGPVIGYSDMPGRDQAAAGIRAGARTISKMATKGLNAGLQYPEIYKEERESQSKANEYISKKAPGSVGLGEAAGVAEGVYALGKAGKGLLGGGLKTIHPNIDKAILKRLQALNLTEKESKMVLDNYDEIQRLYKEKGRVLTEEDLIGVVDKVTGKKSPGLIAKTQKALTDWYSKNKKDFDGLYDQLDEVHSADTLPTESIGEDLKQIIGDNSITFKKEVAPSLGKVASEAKDVTISPIKGKTLSSAQDTLSLIESGQPVSYSDYRKLQKVFNQLSAWDKKGDLTDGEVVARQIAHKLGDVWNGVKGFEDVAAVNKKYREFNDLIDLWNSYASTKQWHFKSGKTNKLEMKGKIEGVLKKLFDPLKAESADEFLRNTENMSPVARATIEELMTKMAGDVFTTGKESSRIGTTGLWSPSSGFRTRFSFIDPTKLANKVYTSLLMKHRKDLEAGNYLKMFGTPMEAGEFVTNVLGRLIKGYYQGAKDRETAQTNPTPSLSRQFQ
jgi:hypothetical protein